MGDSIRVHSMTLGMARAYLVENQRGLLLVDAGSPGQGGRVQHLMGELGRDDLRLIFITHAHLDHYGSAAALRRATGAPVAIHRQDARAMHSGETPLGAVRGRGVIIKRLLPVLMPLFGLEPTPADLILEDNQDLREFGFPATVIHTPGHTPGSCCLLLEGRYAFAGDLPRTRRQTLLDQAQGLGQTLEIPARRLVRNLWVQNTLALRLGRLAPA